MLVPAFEWRIQLWKLPALIPNRQSGALLLEPSTKSYFASEKVKLIPLFFPFFKSSSKCVKQAPLCQLPNANPKTNRWEDKVAKAPFSTSTPTPLPGGPRFPVVSLFGGFYTQGRAGGDRWDGQGWAFPLEGFRRAIVKGELVDQMVPHISV